MQVSAIQVRENDAKEWITVNHRAAMLLVEKGWQIQHLIPLTDVAQSIKPLIDVVQAIQSALTEALSPMSPPKAETIEKLNDLALGPRMTAALKEVGVPA